MPRAQRRGRRRRPIHLLCRDRQSRRPEAHIHRRRIGEDADQARVGAPPDRPQDRRRSTFPRRPTAPRSTASMRKSRAWSMRGQKFRRRATARRCARSTIPPPRRSRAISAASCSTTRPIPCRAGSWSSRVLIRPRSALPTSSRSIGSSGSAANVSEQDILDHGATQIADPNGGVLLVDDQGLDAAFRGASSTLERTYTTSSVAALPARAGERACLREGRHLRNPHRQSVAEPDPASACEGARPAAGADRAAPVFARRRLRPATERRLHCAGGARRQGAWQAGEAGADAR